LLLAPGERADVLIDFTDLAGKSFIVYNDAPAPFPGGDPRNDYFTGDPNFTDPTKNTFGLSGGAPTTLAGHGPNTRTILKIVVSHAAPGIKIDGSFVTALNIQLANNFKGGNSVPQQQPPLLFNSGDGATPDFPFVGPADRMLTLNEDFDEFGRLIQMLGTFTQNGTNNQGLPTWSLPYLDAATETPSAGDTEVWQIMNLTGDTHPIPSTSTW